MKKFLMRKIVEPEITLRVWELIIILVIQYAGLALFYLGITNKI